MKQRSQKQNKRIHERFEAYLKGAGLKQTQQRLLILDTLLNAKGHVDAETITKTAKENDTTLGSATVYRTLQLLKEAGIVTQRHFHADRMVYELADLEDDHHDHLICNQCGAIIEFFDAEVEKQQERLVKKLGFKLTDHKMDLFADCNKWPTCPRIKR